MEITVDELFWNKWGIHGIKHALRSMVLAHEISKAIDLNTIDTKVSSLAALYHDTGRTNDALDYSHGRKTVEKLRAYGLDKRILACFNSEDDLLLFNKIIAAHSLPDAKQADFKAEIPDHLEERFARLYSVLKDADGLDRLRINDLDPSYLRNEASVELIDFAKYLLETPSHLEPYINNLKNKFPDIVTVSPKLWEYIDEINLLE